MDDRVERILMKVRDLTEQKRLIWELLDDPDGPFRVTLKAQSAGGIIILQGYFIQGESDSYVLELQDTKGSTIERLAPESSSLALVLEELYDLALARATGKDEKLDKLIEGLEKLEGPRQGGF